MKSYRNSLKAIVIISTLFLSLGLVSANELPTVDLNQPEGEGTSTQPTFEWTGEDEDGDSLDYKLVVGVNGGNPFLSPEYTKNYRNRNPGQTMSVSPFEFEDNQEYTWAVIADDGGIGEARSDEWTFTTLDQNRAPQVTLREPDNGDTISLPYNFEWDVSDPENDEISYNKLIIKQDGDIVKDVNVGSSEDLEIDRDDLDNGDHTWYVTSKDVEGNTGTSGSKRFTVEEDTDEDANLEIHVEDNDGFNGKEMEDARVTLSDGANRGPKYTNYNGDVDFDNLPSDTDIDIEVRCYGETENRYNIELDEGENRELDINFEEDFETDDCGDENEQELTARFDIDDRNPDVEQWVYFDASDSDGNIEEYRWDFGDGDDYTDDDPRVRHRYNFEGEYTVELTVEEYDGDEDTETKTIDVGRDEEETNSAPDVNLVQPGNNQRINLPYTLRWDVSDPENDDVDSTVYVARDRDSQSIRDGDYVLREDVGESESFRLYRSDLENRDYKWRVKATDEHGKTTWSGIRGFEVTRDRDRTGNAYLNVFVDDEDGDPIRDARVVADNENWFSQETDSDGEASFEVQSGNVDITVSKDGYRTSTRNLRISPDEDRDIYFTLRERSDNDRDEEARLDIHVEDDSYDELEDARVSVENGDDEVRYTDSGGDARFYLDSDSYDIEVQCNDEEEYRSVYLSEGERETVDIRFDEDFDSDLCGEDDYDRPDYDDGNDQEGLAITDVSYPNSVCRGGSFSVNMRIENRGGYHELVSITGSGLGSINTGQSFSLDVSETKSANLRFTNVEGSGREEFTIRATNHDSAQTTRTIDVRGCTGQLPDNGGDFTGSATGITAEVSPSQTVVGEAIQVKGYVDGVRGRSEVTIRANGERKTTVSTQPDGYYVSYIRLDEIGDNIIRVSSGDAETESVVELIPTSAISGVSAPDQVFEGENYEVCADIQSQINPKVLLMKNGKVADTTYGSGEVCFARQASDIGESDYSIKTLTYGRASSSNSVSTEVLEVDSEVKNFPDKVATTESEEGMVKVELYNTHNDLRRYNVRLNGIESTWLSQSSKEVILNKGERETVYFYLTPEEEGNYNPTVEVSSRDGTIFSQRINVYAGGTKNPKKQSFFNRLGNLLSF